MEEILNKLVELAELRKEATPGPWTHQEPHLVACPRQYNIADTWERQTSRAQCVGNAAFIAAAGSIDFADVLRAITCLTESEQVAAGETLRLQEVKSSNEREIAALRNYIDCLLTELIAHPELPDAISKKLKAHRQTLTITATPSQETEVRDAA